MNGYGDLGYLFLEESAADDVVAVLSELGEAGRRTDREALRLQLAAWWLAVTTSGFNGYGLSCFGRSYGLYLERDLTLRIEREERLSKAERAALAVARRDLDTLAAAWGLRGELTLAVGDIGVRGRLSALAGRLG